MKVNRTENVESEKCFTPMVADLSGYILSVLQRMYVIPKGQHICLKFEIVVKFSLQESL